MAVQTKKSSTEKVAHDNNNYLGLQPELDSDQDLARRCQLLKELCVTLDKHAEQPQQPSAMGYTHADLQQFLTSSTLRHTFPSEEEEDTAQVQLVLKLIVNSAKMF